MGSPRYRFVLVEEAGATLPVRYRARRPSFPVWIRQSEPMEALLDAFLRLSWRGVGDHAWAGSLSENPLAFLLDALGDPVIVRRREGRPMYANPAARELPTLEWSVNPYEPELETIEVRGQRYQRRCMSFQQGGEIYLLEVLRRMS